MAEIPLSGFVGLPDEPQVHLDRAPLVLVLCQVRFSSVLKISDPSYIAGFQDAIRSSFPIVGKKQPLDFQIDLTAQTVRSSRQQQLEWHFTDLAGTSQVILTPDFIALETRTYDSFDAFAAQLGEALEALKEQIGPGVITRVGLRYINELRSQDMDWGDVVNPSLLGPLQNLSLVGQASQVRQMTQLRMSFPDGGGVTVGYGVQPNGTTVLPRAGEKPPTGKFFLLDYDISRQPARPTPFTLDRIVSDVRDFNVLAYRLFAWSTTKQYRESLEPRG
jgi:uncharacterized protein (TIGR04255 family)